jgi:hypothetical protein
LKEILFPTLISISFKNKRNFQILDQELNVELLINYIQNNIRDELPHILEDDNDRLSMGSSIGGGGRSVGKAHHRSPSISSTTSSN